MTTQSPAPDLAKIKEGQLRTWASGDFAMIGTTTTVIIGELLCEAADLRPGQRVLDVATGSGNTAIAAARRFAEATGVDYVPALLDRARERAAVERLAVTFQSGDAEELPFPDGSFDVALSTFGAMFAPNQERAAAELLRVCRSGGKIAMANWTPDGFVGETFRTTARYLPPSPGLKPAMRWGTEEGLRELFGDGITSLEITRRSAMFRFRSAQHWIEYFRTYYGPTLKAFAALDAVKQEGLAQDLVALVERFNRSGDETMVVPGDYLEIVAIKR